MSLVSIYLLGIIIYALVIPRTYYKYCKINCQSEREIKSIILLLASIIWPISIVFFILVFFTECCELSVLKVVNFIIGIPNKED